MTGLENMLAIPSPDESIPQPITLSRFCHPNNEEDGEDEYGYGNLDATSFSVLHTYYLYLNRPDIDRSHIATQYHQLIYYATKARRYDCAFVNELDGVRNLVKLLCPLKVLYS